MAKRYTLEVSGLILGRVDGTLAQACQKAARLARGFDTEIDVFGHFPTRIEVVAMVNGKGEVAYPVAI